MSRIADALQSADRESKSFQTPECQSNTIPSDIQTYRHKHTHILLKIEATCQGEILLSVWKLEPI